MNADQRLNRRIVEKVEESDADRRVKDFILDILYFEKSVDQEGRVQYSDDYRALIDKHVKSGNEQ